MTKITTTSKTLADVPKKYCRVILTEDKPSWHRLVEKADGTLEYHLGAGKRKSATPRSYRTLIRSIVQAAKAHQLEHIAIHLGVMGSPKLEAMGEEWFWRTLGENLELAQYEFRLYKTTKKETKELQEILACGIDTPAKKRTTRALPFSHSDESSLKIRSSFLAGLTIGESANKARDIANTCGDDMTPSIMATTAKEILKGTKTTIKILDKAAIKREKMGLIEAVGKGANDAPKVIVIEYWGAGKPAKNDKKKAPIALIGKGITYDTGGLNVKPSGYMHEMHMDMSGGAAVIGVMHAVATLGIKKNIVAIIPVAENAISRDSMRAGDIATAMSGKTVEILHTDAEGRLVLADAMTYAEKYYTPRVMIDVATLTGASLVAVGTLASVVLTKNDNLRETLVKLGEETGDLTWPLPLWDEYKQSLKSHRADISNIATDFSRYAGCIEGATFLSYFAPKKTPWVHIDIAPRMTSTASDKLAKGATGEPVRLLVRFVETY